MKPLLSICIPTYNGAHLLEIALQALLPQTSPEVSEPVRQRGSDVFKIVPITSGA